MGLWSLFTPKECHNPVYHLMRASTNQSKLPGKPTSYSIVRNVSETRGDFNFLLKRFFDRSYKMRAIISLIRFLSIKCEDSSKNYQFLQMIVIEIQMFKNSIWGVITSWLIKYYTQGNYIGNKLNINYQTRTHGALKYI